MNSNKGISYEVLSPWADADPVPFRAINARISDLAGKRIGIFCNTKRVAEPTLKAVETRLKIKYPSVTISWFFNTAPNEAIIEQPRKGEFENWLQGVDEVIAAYGDWGSCTKYLVYDAVSIEDRKKPVVMLANYGFANDAESAARSKGMPGVRVIPTKVPCESTVKTDIEAGIDDAWDDIIDALTSPLNPREKSPRDERGEKPQRIIFKGNLEEVNRFFYRRGWTDGLPVIPPSEEAVAEMLTGTDLPADHLLGKLQSRLGKATVEKIAINAVMAGALPTYLPVLIAGTINLLESEQGFLGYTTFGFSTGSWSPFWVINGPIRNQLNINNGSGAFSPGNIANAAIGRAMGLIIKNIGGVRKGIEDMGVMGNPMKYTMVIAENEEESPWEPLHVEYGYDKEDSTISLSFPQSYLQHYPPGSDAVSILQSVIDNIPRSMRYTLVFNPATARNLHRGGYSKETLKKYIVENKLVPAAKLLASNAVITPDSKLQQSSGDDTNMVPLIKDPRFIRVIVGGGPGAFVAHLIGGGATPGKKEIQKIELPGNWDKLVTKYKNLVPVYAKY